MPIAPPTGAASKPTALERLGRRIADELDPDLLIDGIHRETEEDAERRRCSDGLDGLLYWLDTYCRLANPKADDPADREFPLKLWPRQRDELVPWLFNGYGAGGEQVLNKSREIGATWLALHVIWWFWRFERDFSALLISREERLVDDGGAPKSGAAASLASLFGKLDFITSRQPRFLRPRVYRKKLVLRNLETRSTIMGSATSVGAARSTRHSIVLIDEAAHIDAGKQRGIRTALESVARSLWWISSPNGRGNEFGFMVTAHRGNPRRYLELDWTTNPERDLEWFEGLLVENGGRLTWDTRAQEYCCSLAGVSGVRVWKAPADSNLYGDEDLPEARESFFVVAPMDFGSGPSWTTCLWLLVSWDHSPHPSYPLIFVDRERYWSREPAGEIAATIIQTHQGAGYGQHFFYTGDPAGRAAESDQGSWESRLQEGGVPIQCLPGEFNTADALNVEGVEQVQTLIDGQLLRFHRDLVPVTLQTLESWEWNLPPGIDPQFVSREALSPRKDGWSHVGQALIYGVRWVLLYGRQRHEDLAAVAAALPERGAAAIAGVYGRL